MSGKKLAVVLAEDNYECLELHYPKLRLQEAGFDVKVAGVKKGEIFKSKEGYWAKSDCVFADIDPTQVAVIIVPGGFCPDRLRRYQDCLDLVAKVNEAGGVVGTC
jgi:protease I